MRIDAQLLVKRREHVPEFHGTLHAFAAVAASGTDDLAVTHSAAGEQRKGHVRPMVPARVLVDFWGAPELTPDDHAHIPVHAPRMQVFDERGQALVQQRKLLARLPEVVAVPVPTAERDRYAAHPGLHQPTRHEEVIQQAVRTVILQIREAAAIAVAQLLVLLVQVQGIGQPAGGQHRKGLLMEGIEALDHSAVVHIAAELIERGEQRAALTEPVGRDSVQHHVVLALFVGLERRVCGTEKARLPRIAPGTMARVGCQPDEGWNSGSGGAL